MRNPADSANPTIGCRRDEFVLLAAVLAWTFLLGCTTLRDFDIWWHLKTGQLILERGTLPQSDWFTFVDWDKPWIDLHWGFQLLVTGLYAVGGTELLVLAKAGCLTAVIVVGWLASGRELPAWLAVACWTLPIICISTRAVVRPEILSFLFLATWLLLISRIDRRPRYAWWLPVLQVVWINFHGLFVLGYVVAAAYLVDRLLRQLAGGSCGLEPVDSLLGLRQLFRVGVLTVLAALVNPYFEEGALFPLVLFRKFSVDKQLYLTIGEFTPPVEIVRQSGGVGIYPLCGLALFLATVCSFLWLAREKRISPLRIILFVAFSYLAWQAWRNLSLMGLVAGFVLCANVADARRLRQCRLMERDRKRATATRRSGVVDGHPASVSRRPTLVMTGIVIALAAAVPVGRWHEWCDDGRRFGLGEDEPMHRYAHAACKFAGQDGLPSRAFVAHLGQAGVYIFHNAPERRVFMDARLEVSTPETFRQYQDILAMMRYRPGQRPDDRWAELLRDRAGNLPVVILDSRLMREAINGLSRSPRWRLVFAEPAAAVFLDVAQADRLNLPPADPSPLIEPPGEKTIRRPL